jgi:hypothetical protein
LSTKILSSGKKARSERALRAVVEVENHTGRFVSEDYGNVGTAIGRRCSTGAIARNGQASPIQKLATDETISSAQVLRIDAVGDLKDAGGVVSAAKSDPENLIPGQRG